MPDYISVLTSPEGKSEVMCAYQAIMDEWPVPDQELTIPTKSGAKHVNASGPKDAPPVVLLYALLTTAILKSGLALLRMYSRAGSLL